MTLTFDLSASTIGQISFRVPADKGQSDGQTDANGMHDVYPGKCKTVQVLKMSEL